MGDHGPLHRSVLDPGNDGRDGNNAHGQESPADEAVEKRTLPRLELAENGHVDEGILPDQGATDMRGALQGDDPQVVADRLHDIQDLPGRRLDRLDVFVHPFHKKTPPVCLLGESRLAFAALPAPSGSDLLGRSHQPVRRLSGELHHPSYMSCQ